MLTSDQAAVLAAGAGGHGHKVYQLVDQAKILAAGLTAGLESAEVRGAMQLAASAYGCAYPADFGVLASSKMSAAFDRARAGAGAAATADKQDQAVPGTSAWTTTLTPPAGHWLALTAASDASCDYECYLRTYFWLTIDQWLVYDTQSPETTRQNLLKDDQQTSKPAFEWLQDVANGSGAERDEAHGFYPVLGASAYWGSSAAEGERHFFHPSAKAAGGWALMPNSVVGGAVHLYAGAAPSTALGGTASQMAQAKDFTAKYELTGAAASTCRAYQAPPAPAQDDTKKALAAVAAAALAVGKRAKGLNDSLLSGGAA